MLKLVQRLVVGAAAVSMFLALASTPSNAVPVNWSGAVTVTGTASCNAGTGHPTWTLHWTIANTLAYEQVTSGITNAALVSVSVVVQSANETGLVTTDILSAVNPTTIPADGTATATDGPIPNATGDVTLSVGWATDGNQGTAAGTVHLDGTCVLAEPTTVAPTTTAPAAVKTAVAAAPSFTG